MSVRTIQLGEVCEFVYGDSLKEERRRPGKVPVFGSNGIVGWHDQAITSGPAIVIGRKGSIGKINWSNEPCFPIDTTYFVEKTKKPCHLRWLYFTLLKLDLTRFNKSAAIPGLNREDAYEQRISWPDLTVQKRIAGLLEQVDRLRRTRQYVLELSDTLLPAAFLEVFGDPKENLRKWPKHYLSDVCLRFSDGPFGSNLKSEHYRPSGVRVIRLNNIGVGEFLRGNQAFISAEHFGTLQKHECLPGDVLIGTLGDPNLRACIQPAEIKVALNKADCVQARTDPNKANAEYLCGLLNMPSTLNLVPGMVHGQTRARVSMGELAELPIPIPPLSLQKHFAALVERHERARARQREALRQADHLFQSLLNRAFR